LVVLITFTKAGGSREMTIGPLITDSVARWTDLAINELWDNELVQKIPFLGEAVSAVRLGLGISERIFLNKVQRFVEQAGDLSEEEKEKIAEELEEEKKSRLKWGEAVLTVIDQSDSSVKIDYVAWAVVAFARGDLSAQELRELCHAINVTQVDKLVAFAENSPLSKEDELVHTGLVESSLPPTPTTSGAVRVRPKYKPTRLGRLLRGIVKRVKAEQVLRGGVSPGDSK
jgi:hypothetical protein